MHQMTPMLDWVLIGLAAMLFVFCIKVLRSGALADQPPSARLLVSTAAFAAGSATLVGSVIMLTGR